MGGRTSKNEDRKGPPPKPEVGFDDFEVLRAIGRGSFGKVCLVESKLIKKVFAMKYVNKEACLKQNAVQNVISEVELLRAVDHPFVVSLWYTFQDAEDFFIILEPLLGGDMRYHMNGGSFHFTEEMVRFVCAEIGAALDFLRSRSIIHRDVKPDNILLNDAGHAHLTDFNVATCIKNSDKLAHTMAGTKPYMAPEIFYTAASGNAGLPGYTFSADWWSLGITAYELKTGRRPFEIHSRTSISSVVAIFNAISQTSGESIYPPQWSPEFTKFIQLLLTINPEKRLSSVYQMKTSTKLMSNVNFVTLLQKKLPPPFVPNQNVLNCDPTYELEEMIIEAKPLHKKKKRLLRQQTLLTQHPSGDKLSSILEANEEKCAAFPVYNREWERYQDSLREKETEWEKELKQLMEKSNPGEEKVKTDHTVPPLATHMEEASMTSL